MSFRELKNFTETMRVLGYPRPISLESFRSPNFPLVADVLSWLVHRYDPAIDVLVENLSTEDNRVSFLKNMAQMLVSRGRIKLHTTRLYAADGRAVKELLKLAKILRQASDTRRTLHSSDSGTAALPASSTTRSLASSITSLGASLYDLLGKEPEARVERAACLGKPFVLQDIESAIQRRIDRGRTTVDDLVVDLEKQMEDQSSLKAKIEKKTTNLERNKKRLRLLWSMRPAFMDDYERYEQELANLYSIYVEKYRNVEYLKHLVEKHEEDMKRRQDERERNIERMRKKVKDDEIDLLRAGEEELELGAELDEMGMRFAEVEGDASMTRVKGSLYAGDEEDDDETDDDVSDLGSTSTSRSAISGETSEGDDGFPDSDSPNGIDNDDEEDEEDEDDDF